MEKFTIGLALGALVGAFVLANSQKTRQLFIKSQDELKSRIDELIDEKLQSLSQEEEDDEEEDETELSARIKPKRTGLMKSKK